MTNSLIFFAIVVAGFGVLSLSQATIGVGLICLGCFIAILARIAQASQQK